MSSENKKDKKDKNIQTVFNRVRLNYANTEISRAA